MLNDSLKLTNNYILISNNLNFFSKRMSPDTVIRIEKILLAVHILRDMNKEQIFT